MSYILELEKGKRSLKPTVVLQKVRACMKHEWPGTGRGWGGVKKNNLLGLKKERRAVGGERWASLSLCHSLQLCYLLTFLWLHLGEGGKNIQRM